MAPQIFLVDISAEAKVTFVWPSLFLFGEDPVVKAENAWDRSADGLEGFSYQLQTLNNEYKRPFSADAFLSAHSPGS